MDRLLEFAGEPDPSVRDQTDFFAKLAKRGLARILGGAMAAARQAPAACVAEPHEDQVAFGRQRIGMRAKGARPANEPAEAEQPVGRRKRQAQCRVD